MADNVDAQERQDAEVSSIETALHNPFLRVPSLHEEFRYFFLHPTFPDWPSGHVAVLHQLVRYLQFTLEEVVDSVVRVASMASTVHPAIPFGLSVPPTTFSDLVLGKLRHQTYPFWSETQVRLIEEGALTLLLLLEDAIEEARCKASFNNCFCLLYTSPSPRDRG